MDPQVQAKFKSIGISLAYHRSVGKLHRLGYFHPVEGILKELNIEAGSIQELLLKIDMAIKNA